VASATEVRRTLVRVALGPMRIIVAALMIVLTVVHLIAVVGAFYMRAFGKMLDTIGTKNDGD
jgi:hypothetical protein